MLDADIPYLRNWLRYDQRIILLGYFYRVARELSSRLIADPNRNEVGLTDELVYVMTKSEDLVEWLRYNLHETELRLELEARKIKQFEESRIGADIGVLLRVQTRTHSMEKAILLQAKRLKPDNGSFSPESRYDELTSNRGLYQAKRMLGITPASFFILYNPPMAFTRSIKNFVGSTDTTGTFNLVENDMSPAFRTGNDDITILPASTRIALTCEGTIRSLHRFTVPFGSFMVDDFFQCKVGDSSTKAKKVVYGKDEDNAVRYSLILNISEED
jgi:hypothetical protein